MMTKIDSHLCWTIEIYHSLGPQTDYVSSHEIPECRHEGKRENLQEIAGAKIE